MNDTFIVYKAGENGAGLNDFVAPQLDLQGSEDFSLSRLVVLVKGVETQAYSYDELTGVVHLDTDASLGDIVELRRFTDVQTPASVFPSILKLTTRALNKGFSQVLLKIQEMVSETKKALGITVDPTTGEQVLDTQGLRIVNVGDPEVNTDVATKGYTDAADVIATSHSMKNTSGTWNAQSLPVKNLGNPVAPTDATTKEYVDNRATQAAADAMKLETGGWEARGQKIKNLGRGTSDTDAATIKDAKLIARDATVHPPASPEAPAPPDTVVATPQELSAKIEITINNPPLDLKGFAIFLVNDDDTTGDLLATVASYGNTAKTTIYNLLPDIPVKFRVFSYSTWVLTSVTGTDSNTVTPAAIDGHQFVPGSIVGSAIDDSIARVSDAITNINNDPNSVTIDANKISSDVMLASQGILVGHAVDDINNFHGTTITEEAISTDLMRVNQGILVGGAVGDIGENGLPLDHLAETVITPGTLSVKLRDGTTVISGDNILTGTVSADRIDVAGVISAGQILVQGDAASDIPPGTYVPGTLNDTSVTDGVSLVNAINHGSTSIRGGLIETAGLLAQFANTHSITTDMLQAGIIVSTDDLVNQINTHGSGTINETKLNLSNYPTNSDLSTSLLGYVQNSTLLNYATKDKLIDTINTVNQTGGQTVIDGGLINTNFITANGIALKPNLVSDLNALEDGGFTLILPGLIDVDNLVVKHVEAHSINTDSIVVGGLDSIAVPNAIFGGGITGIDPMAVGDNILAKANRGKIDFSYEVSNNSYSVTAGMKPDAFTVLEDGYGDSLPSVTFAPAGSDEMDLGADLYGVCGRYKITSWGTGGSGDKGVKFLSEKIPVEGNRSIGFKFRARFIGTNYGFAYLSISLKAFDSTGTLVTSASLTGPSSYGSAPTYGVLHKSIQLPPTATALQIEIITTRGGSNNIADTDSLYLGGWELAYIDGYETEFVNAKAYDTGGTLKDLNTQYRGRISSYSQESVTKTAERVFFGLTNWSTTGLSDGTSYINTVGAVLFGEDPVEVGSLSPTPSGNFTGTTRTVYIDGVCSIAMAVVNTTGSTISGTITATHVHGKSGQASSFTGETITLEPSHAKIIHLVGDIAHSVVGDFEELSNMGTLTINIPSSLTGALFSEPCLRPGAMSILPSNLTANQYKKSHFYDCLFHIIKAYTGWFTNLNVSNNLLVPTYDSLPAVSTAGSICFYTGNSRFYGFDGNQWRKMT